MVTLSTHVQTGPNGTVSLYVDMASGELRVHAELDPDQADWAWADEFITKASGGQPVQCHEEYEPGVNVFVVMIAAAVLPAVSTRPLLALRK